jgi:endonuclease G
MGNIYTTNKKKRRRKKSSISPMAVVIIAALVVIFFIFSAWKSSTANATTESQSDNETSIVDAQKLMQVKLPDELPSVIVDYTGFTVSFNAVQHVPNYVAWELTGEESEGELPRESNFMADDNVYGCASLDDYRRSGYDRGHMAPAADMKWSEKSMADCHYLTNICPQTHKLNAGSWKTLEDNCRSWARRDSAIIIICGPVLSDEITNRIGKNEVAVPERFFKVVIAPFANPPRGIGFVMANNEVSNGGVQTAAMTIDEVEAITGYDFFYALPDSIENDIESQCNYPLWQRKKH